MKILYSDIYKYGTYLVILLNLGLINIFMPNQTPSMVVSIITSILLFLIYVRQPNKIKIKSIWLKLFIVLLFVLFFYELIRLKSISNPSISIQGAIAFYGGFFLVLLAFPIYEVVNYDKSFIQNIVIIGYVFLIYKFIAWAAFNFVHIDIAPGLLATRSNWTRALLGINFVRMSGTFMDPIMLIYSFYNFLNNKKFINLIGAIFIYAYSLVVFQSRSKFLYFTFIFILMILLKSFTADNKVTSIIISLGILIVFFIFSFREFKAFFNTFSVNSAEYGGSTMVRLQGLDYLQQMWNTTNKFWGFGYTPDNFIRIGLTDYWLSDQGIIEILYQFGYYGFLVALMPFINAIIDIIKIMYYKKINNLNVLTIGLSVYMIISCANTNYYGFSLIITLPILLALLFFSEKDINMRDSY